MESGSNHAKEVKNARKATNFACRPCARHLYCDAVVQTEVHICRYVYWASRRNKKLLKDCICLNVTRAHAHMHIHTVAKTDRSEANTNAHKHAQTNAQSCADKVNTHVHTRMRTRKIRHEHNRTHATTHARTHARIRTHARAHTHTRTYANTHKHKIASHMKLGLRCGGDPSLDLNAGLSR